MIKEDIENIGHALSTVIQTRYVWLFNHMARALFLDYFDKMNKIPFSLYSFSEEDEAKGIKPLEARYVTDLLRKNNKEMAYSDRGQSYGYEYVREITISGLRGAFLTSMQSYLEYYRILSICKKYNLADRGLFDFVRQARNIVCHSNGIMDSPKIKRCQWRHIVIERNRKELK